MGVQNQCWFNYGFLKNRKAAKISLTFGNNRSSLTDFLKHYELEVQRSRSSKGFTFNDFYKNKCNLAMEQWTFCKQDYIVWIPRIFGAKFVGRSGAIPFLMPRGLQWKPRIYKKIEMYINFTLEVLSSSLIIKSDTELKGVYWKGRRSKQIKAKLRHFKAKYSIWNTVGIERSLEQQKVICETYLSAVMLPRNRIMRYSQYYTQNKWITVTFWDI